jgi:pre-mRNA cleavage complex 2 protein Pcf11
MSSLSPRASISGNASAAVSEDFADSLRDLTQNNRYEISNLTIIAKENTEHAQAISKALESHIKTVRHRFAMKEKKQKRFLVCYCWLLLVDIEA